MDLPPPLKSTGREGFSPKIDPFPSKTRICVDSPNTNPAYTSMVSWSFNLKRGAIQPPSFLAGPFSSMHHTDSLGSTPLTFDRSTSCSEYVSEPQ